ncbi:MAG: hypothetical protein JWP81_3881 [Ferruginibacter sp.]|nr:hypothetical protein [Ferruginibacter sp.]
MMTVAIPAAVKDPQWYAVQVSEHNGDAMETNVCKQKFSALLI